MSPAAFDASKPLELGEVVWVRARVIEEHGGLYFDPISQTEWHRELPDAPAPVPPAGGGEDDEKFLRMIDDIIGADNDRPSATRYVPKGHLLRLVNLARLALSHRSASQATRDEVAQIAELLYLRGFGLMRACTPLAEKIVALRTKPATQVNKAAKEPQ